MAEENRKIAGLTPDCFFLLEWILKLQYTNRSDRTVLLDRNNYRVTRTLVSRDLEAAARKQYIYNPIPVYTDLKPLGFRPTPDEASFIILKPA